MTGEEMMDLASLSGPLAAAHAERSLDDEQRALRTALVREVAWLELGADGSLKEVAWRHNLTVEELAGWLEDEDFWPAVRERAAQMRASGEEHRQKARGMVAEMLPEAAKMFYAESTAPAVRAQIFKELARQAGLGGEEREGGVPPKVEVLIDMRGQGAGGPVVAARSTGELGPVV